MQIDFDFERFSTERCILMTFGEVNWAQKDGNPPTLFETNSPPGESGVSVLRTRFEQGANFSATPGQHLIFLQVSERLRIECSIGGRTLGHEPRAGSIAICPAGMDCSAQTDSSMDSLVIAIKPEYLTLATAEHSAIDAQLNECLSGYDQTLFSTARLLASESANGYPNGPLHWNDTVNSFIDQVVFSHTSVPKTPARGRLSRPVLQKIRDYILANLAEPIEVADLAALAGKSAFHFSRIFTRSVGMTPHHYVVHLRLQAALRHIRDGRMSLAEIAADTGFSDQSHLSRWIRRVHGAAPSQLS
jgi:AraC family transcriptional regulator